MTSTTAAGQPEVPDEIKALFSWNPPRLCPAPKTKSSTKSSTATRSPAFYGKHFSSDLVVKKVVRLPSLVRDLAGNVDRVLDALETIPPLEGFFKFRAEQREDSNDAGFIKGCGKRESSCRVLQPHHRQILLARGFNARSAPFISSMAQSLVLDAIRSFLRLHKDGRTAPLP